MYQVSLSLLNNHLKISIDEISNKNIYIFAYEKNKFWIDLILCWRIDLEAILNNSCVD